MIPQIIATIGQGSRDDACMHALADAGASVLRYNAATLSTLEQTAELIVRARLSFARRATPAPAFMVDLPFPGAKRRLFTFQGREHDAPRGSRFTLVCHRDEMIDAQHVYVELTSFDGIVAEGQVLIVGDGELAFCVERLIGDRRCEVTALSDWYLSDGKAIHVPLAERKRVLDASDYVAGLIAAFAEARPEYLALSFVESGGDVTRVRELLAQEACPFQTKLVAKIETATALDHLDDILAACDVVMVARGDLAIQAPYERLGLHQRRVLHAARKRGVPTVVATQILETTMRRYLPNRSEIVDLTSMVLDRVWAVMLAKETSAPGNPVYPVKVAKRIIDEVVAARELAGEDIDV